MQKNNKVHPHLWFDKEATTAAKFYCSIFPDSKITDTKVIKDTPSGDCDVVSFQLCGEPFQAISAGPYFKFNPSVSFMVNFDPSRDSNAQQKLDETWKKLSEGGTALMPLDEYPFSKRYGWIQDKFGLSWQLILMTPQTDSWPRIVPSMMFVGSVCGKAEEASDFYMSVFKNSKRGMLERYPAGAEPDKEGSVMYTDFQLGNKWFAAMDSAQQHKFSFNEAISLVVNCDSQEEIDFYWERLSAVPQSEQCGWCKDKYGLSWQVVPSVTGEMMSKGSPEQLKRVTQAFMKMKKFDIQQLKDAYEGAGVPA